jgi:hypothetical protein
MARYIEGILDREIDMLSLRCLLRRSVKPSLIVDFRDLDNDIELHPLPEADALRLYDRNDPREVWVCGERNVKLYDPRAQASRRSYLETLYRSIEGIVECVKK